MTKFFAVVFVCGLYQQTQHICMEWTDQSWFASRSQCMARAQTIAKDLKDRVWYWRGLKLDRSPNPSCKGH